MSATKNVTIQHTKYIAKTGVFEGHLKSYFYLNMLNTCSIVKYMLQCKQFVLEQQQQLLN